MLLSPVRVSAVHPWHFHMEDMPIHRSPLNFYIKFIIYAYAVTQLRFVRSVSNTVPDVSNLTGNAKQDAFQSVRKMGKLSPKSAHESGKNAMNSAVIWRLRIPS